MTFQAFVRLIFVIDQLTEDLAYDQVISHDEERYYTSRVISAADEKATTQILSRKARVKHIQLGIHWPAFDN